MHRLIVTVILVISAAATTCFAQGDDALTAAAKQISDQFVKSSASKKAEVLKVDQTTTPPNITVMLGTEDGVLEGQLLQILAKGDPLTDENGKVVDFEWIPVGNAEVTLVTGERTCVASLIGTVSSGRLAKGNRAMVKTIPGALAVSAFVRGDGAGSVMGSEFADKLITALQASGRFRVLERSRFETLLSELKLGLNDLFDPRKTVPLGKQLQAKGVVMGKIDQQNAGYTISARVVDVETGAVVGTATTTCVRSDELDGKYAKVVPGDGKTGKIIETKMDQPLFSKDRTWVTPGAPSKLETNVMVGGVCWPQAIHVRDKLGIVLGKSVGPTELEVGVSDDPNAWEAEQLELLVDGQIVQKVPLRRNRPPTLVKIDLTGADALTFRCIGNLNVNAWVRQPGAKMEMPQQ